MLQNESTFCIEGVECASTKRLFYIAIETYQASKLGSNRISFSMVNRQPQRAWTVFLGRGLPLMSCLFPRRACLQPDSDRAVAGTVLAYTKKEMEKEMIFHFQEMEKLKANQIGYIAPSKRINAEHHRKK